MPVPDPYLFGRSQNIKITIYLEPSFDAAGKCAVHSFNSIFHGFGSTRLDTTTGVLFPPHEVLHFRLAEVIPNASRRANAPCTQIISWNALQGWGRRYALRSSWRALKPLATVKPFLSGVLDWEWNIQEAMECTAQLAHDGVVWILNQACLGSP